MTPARVRQLTAVALAMAEQGLGRNVLDEMEQVRPA
jgi:hypothetical protein